MDDQFKKAFAKYDSMSFTLILELDHAELGDILIPKEPKFFQGLTIKNINLDRKPKEGHWSLINTEYTGQMTVDFEAFDQQSIEFSTKLVTDPRLKHRLTNSCLHVDFGDGIAKYHIDPKSLEVRLIQG
jgi:hypothetical protein